MRLHPPGPSQCYVLIKQSGSPCPRQFLASRVGGEPQIYKKRGPLRPAPRASPSPEVTDPICRVPLPALFHRLEAVHPGDLMRFGYGQSPRPPDFHGPRRARRTPFAGAFARCPPCSGRPASGRAGRVGEMRELSSPPVVASPRGAALPLADSGPGILTGFPFGRCARARRNCPGP